MSEFHRSDKDQSILSSWDRRRESRGASAEERTFSKLALSSDRAFSALWPCPALGGSSLTFRV